MITPLEPLALAYRYRHLLGRCASGLGLDFAGIEEVETIEARLGGAGERVHVQATLHSERHEDRVTLVRVGLGGCECRQAPYAAEGDELELVIEEPSRGHTYQFKVRVTWLRDDVNDDYALGLAFIGVPVLMRRMAVSARRPRSERIAA